MKIQINEQYACRIIRINNVETDYFSSFQLNDEYICRIRISNAERSCYEQIKNELYVSIVAQIDNRFITFVDCQIYDRVFRHSENSCQNSINLSFVSSLILDNYKWEYGNNISFAHFVTSLTEITELLGFYPYDVCYSDMISNDNSCIKGNNIYKEIGDGYSFFVVPNKEQSRDGVCLSIQAKIQFDADDKINIKCIKEKLSNICLFFEVLSGEIVTLDSFVDLSVDDKSTEAIGLCNYPKNDLNIFKSPIDARCYLRKSLFKLSDFENIGDAVKRFMSIHQTCFLAFEAYKQVLLDEEIRIGTYNKFLKLMQIVEGYQRDTIEEEKQEQFNSKLEAIIFKLADKEDKEFISQYTTYNGQNFRRCLKEFTKNSLGILGVSKTKAQKQTDKLISDMINDRDAYTHASKDKTPILSNDELVKINYVYKSFFRINVLNKMGMPDDIIKKRFLHDRLFVYYYKDLLDLEIEKNESFSNTGEFDYMMW